MDHGPDLALERYSSDPRLRHELEAAAHRERARILQRFLEQAATALLGHSDRTGARSRAGLEPCC